MNTAQAASGFNLMVHQRRPSQWVTSPFWKPSGRSYTTPLRRRKGWSIPTREQRASTPGAR